MLRRFLSSFLICGGAWAVPPPPDTFVSLAEIDNSIVVEMRYFTPHNFMGRAIPGYRAAKCMLSRTAATALATVQADIHPFGLSLKVYDCYRPQRAVDAFIAWARDASDTKMRGEFYPALDKGNLFKLGYIASKSGHSRGSTVDLTLIPTPAAAQGIFHEGQSLRDCRLPRDKRFDDNSLDMGTGYDCLDPAANTANDSIDKPQLRNRLLLKAVMEKAGFKNYEKEWWHFTLRSEPFPETYFDFEIQ